MEDSTSPDQLRESFRGIAHDKVCVLHAFSTSQADTPQTKQPYVTELDLRLAQIPQSTIDFLCQTIPAVRGGGEGTESEFDYEAWLARVFE
jgi:hypothetical protein